MKKNTRAGPSISTSPALGCFKKNRSSHFNPVGLKTTSSEKWAYLRLGRAATPSQRAK